MESGCAQRIVELVMENDIGGDPVMSGFGTTFRPKYVMHGHFNCSALIYESA